MTRRYLDPEFVWLLAREKLSDKCTNAFEPIIEVNVTTFPRPLVIQHGTLYYRVNERMLKKSCCELPNYDTMVREIVVKCGQFRRVFLNHSAFVQWLTGGNE
jgi:hypothetical protein